MTELEGVHKAEVVVEPESGQGDGYYEEQVSEWAEGSGQAILGNMRCARAAANVARRYGEASLTAFAGDVGRSKSTVYQYARVWRVFGPKLEAGGEWSGDSTRLESLTMSHLVRAVSAPDPVAAAEEAEDEGLSTRQMEARRKEREVPKNVETVVQIVCPACGVASPMGSVETRTVER